MIITKLELTDYRSYVHQTIEFDKGLHVFVGPNGAGNTNLVEAIHYLSLARSFRTVDDSRLIRRGAAAAAIRATIKTGDGRKTIAIGIEPSGKKVLVNDKPLGRLSELLDMANVIVFEPRDVFLFDDFPKARRRFLDTALTKQDRDYLEALTRYERLLKERNELLKRDTVNRVLLATLTEQMVDMARPIVAKREEYLNRINEIIERIVKAIRGDELLVRLAYEPFVPLTDQFERQALSLYQKTLEGDIKRKVTSEGPHREDFRIELDKENIASFGSQGENRLLAIALKLSPYFLIEDKLRRPIVVLDDVLSELDVPTQDRLLNFLLKFEQVFVTTTKYKRDLGIIHDIKNSTIRRRNDHDQQRTAG